MDLILHHINLTAVVTLLDKVLYIKTNNEVIKYGVLLNYPSLCKKEKKKKNRNNTDPSQPAATRKCFCSGEAEK